MTGERVLLAVSVVVTTALVAAICAMLYGSCV